VLISGTLVDAVLGGQDSETYGRDVCRFLALIVQFARDAAPPTHLPSQLLAAKTLVVWLKHYAFPVPAQNIRFVSNAATVLLLLRSCGACRWLWKAFTPFAFSAALF